MNEVNLWGERTRGMELTSNRLVRLRDVEQADLPQMYELQLDPESNRLAVTIPRNADAFATHWNTILRDPNITAKAIVVGDVMAGYISCFKLDGLDAVGYWIGRDFWGKGIASRALELLLRVVAIRPLHARVATSNGAFGAKNKQFDNARAMKNLVAFTASWSVQ